MRGTDFNAAGGGHRKTPVRFLNRKKVQMIAEIIETPAGYGGLRFDHQAMLPAVLHPAVAGSEPQFILAHQHRLPVAPRGRTARPVDTPATGDSFRPSAAGRAPPAVAGCSSTAIGRSSGCRPLPAWLPAPVLPVRPAAAERSAPVRSCAATVPAAARYP